MTHWLTEPEAAEYLGITVENLKNRRYKQQIDGNKSKQGDSMTEVKHWRDQITDAVTHSKSGVATEHVATLWAFEQMWRTKDIHDDRLRELAWEAWQTDAKAHPAKIMQYVHDYRAADVTGYVEQVENERKVQERAEGTGV